MKYYGQYLQDKFLNEIVFKSHRNGVFVDVGAHDGRSLNNTLFFEENYDWKGINIEPIPKIFETLCKYRPNCINLNCAVSSDECQQEFICNSGYTEMLSGLKKHYHDKHYMRLNYELNINGGETNVIDVNTKRLETIFNEYNIKHVNYLSIDVEGAEFDVIQSINFDSVFIDVIQFENNYNDTSIPIIEFLFNKNYRTIYNKEDIIMIHKDSFFYNNAF